MSVKGLDTYTLTSATTNGLSFATYSAPPTAADPCTTTLLVDGVSIWHLLAAHALAPPFASTELAGPFGADSTYTQVRQLGGDYWQLAQATESLVRVFYKRHHVRLVFVVAGSPFSEQTTSQTTAELEAAGMNASFVYLHRFTHRPYVAEGCTCPPCSGAALRRWEAQPLPALAMHQIRCVLQRLHAETEGQTAEVVYVGGSVYEEVGALLQKFDADAILTNDSRFCIVKGIPVLLAQCLPFAALLEHQKGASVTVSPRHCASTRLREVVMEKQSRYPSFGVDVIPAPLTQDELETAASLAAMEAPSPLLFDDAVDLVLGARSKKSSRASVKDKLQLLLVQEVKRQLQRGARKDEPCSLDTDVNVQRCQTLPPFVHTLYRHQVVRVVVERFCLGQFAYWKDVPTFAELLHTIAAVLDLNAVRMFDGEKPDAPVWKVYPRQKLPPRMAPFFSSATPTILADPHAFLATFFCFCQAQTAEEEEVKEKEGEKEKEKETATPLSTRHFFLSCVLWTMHGGLLDAQELRQMAYTFALTGALSEANREQKELTTTTKKNTTEAEQPAPLPAENETQEESEKEEADETEKEPAPTDTINEPKVKQKKKTKRQKEQEALAQQKEKKRLAAEEQAAREGLLELLQRMAAQHAHSQPHTARTEELAHLFARSFEMTYALFALAYRQHHDDNNSCTPTAPLPPLPVPELCDIFSGTALHLVVQCGLTSEAALLAAAGPLSTSARQQALVIPLSREAEALVAAPYQSVSFLNMETFPWTPNPWNPQKPPVYELKRELEPEPEPEPEPAPLPAPEPEPEPKKLNQAKLKKEQLRLKREEEKRKKTEENRKKKEEKRKKKQEAATTQPQENMQQQQQQQPQQPENQS